MKILWSTGVLMSVRLVLVEPEGRINLGFILRLCKNFEVYDIYVVNPKFPINDPEVIEFAAKGADLIKYVKVVKSLDEALSGVDIAICTSAETGEESDVLRHSYSPEILRKVLRRYESVALVFGRESVGLTRSELSKCVSIITIPGNPEYNVMNLSHATAVILYLTWRFRKETKKIKGIDQKYINVLLKYFNEFLDNLSLEERYKEKAKIIFKRIVYLYPLRKGEITTIYRILKSATYLLKKCKDKKLEIESKE